MSLTYGFYDSVGGDRTYNAEQLSSMFEGMIHDGVFEDIGAKLAVTATTGMNIQVGTGRAWFNQMWTKNDSNLVLAVDAAEVVLNRIDIVMLEVNTAVGTRANSIKMLKGTPGSSPVAPTLTNAGTLHQYPLAHIYVGAGVTSIITANITNKIGTVDCPYVTGVLRDLDTVRLEELDADFTTLSNNFGYLDADMQPTIQKTTPYVTTGSVNAYIVTFAFAPTGYANMICQVIASISNTGASTVNVNAKGVKNLKKIAEAGKVDLVTGDIVAGGVYTWIYDGTDMIVLNPTCITTGIFTTTGDMMYASTSRTLTRLGIDADATKILGISGGIPAWLANTRAKITSGTYTGNATTGTVDREINIGFAAKFIYITSGGLVTTGTTSAEYGGYLASGSGTIYSGDNTRRPSSSANGFTVCGGGSSALLNNNGITYYYFVLA